jgi:hypothetical protein
MHQPPVNAPKQRRQQLVTLALNLTADTILAPQAYERILLDQFMEGDLTIDQVLALLERQEQA